LSKDANKIAGSSELKIDRSKFDVRYGSDSFFDNLGDKTIHDEFKLTIQLVADSNT